MDRDSNKPDQLSFWNWLNSWKLWTLYFNAAMTLKYISFISAVCLRRNITTQTDSCLSKHSVSEQRWKRRCQETICYAKKKAWTTLLTLVCSPQHGVQVVEPQQNHSDRKNKTHSHQAHFQTATGHKPSCSMNLPLRELKPAHFKVMVKFSLGDRVVRWFYTDLSAPLVTCTITPQKNNTNT